MLIPLKALKISNKLIAYYRNNLFKEQLEGQLSKLLSAMTVLAE